MKNILFAVVLTYLAFVESKPRIIGGEKANDGEFPFSVAIRTSTIDGRYFCGGALIDAQWVLTAAHCIDNGVEFSLQFGSNKLSGTDSSRLTIVANVSVLHPDYEMETFANDLGLIQLPEKIEVSDLIQPIALPTEELTTGTVGRIIGWGQTDDMVSGPVEDLNQVEVVTLDNVLCQHIYGDLIIKELVCISGNYNEGTCIGDNGSPLVVYIEDGTPVHAGVATFFSSNGCENLDPSGFTRTFAYLDWINTTINA